MNLQITTREEALIYESVIGRIRTVEKLIEGWENNPDEHTDDLIGHYSKDLEVLKGLEGKLLKS